jgi:hypothetical protein
MKLNIVNPILGFILFLGLSGCDALDALKATKEMNGKMDGMNTKMESMNNKMESMNNKMDSTNQSMQKTVDGVHGQELLLPLENMLTTESLEYIVPVPTALMPFAKKFAEAATPAELMDLTLIWLNQINNVTPLGNVDTTGNAKDMSDEEFNSLRKHRIGKAMALAAIAGFTPQNVVEQIIVENVKHSSRHLPTAFKFLALRAFFIKEVLLEKSLLDGLMSSVGILEDSVKYMNLLTYLVNLSFSKSIAVHTTGLSEVFYEDINYSLNDENVKAIDSTWVKIKNKAEIDLADYQARNVTGDKTQDDEAYKDELNRISVALARVNEAIAASKTNLPN